MPVIESGIDSFEVPATPIIQGVSGRRFHRQPSANAECIALANTISKIIWAESFISSARGNKYFSMNGAVAQNTLESDIERFDCRSQ